MTNFPAINLDDILLSVEKPSRYTGGELNAVRKDPAGRLSFALAFPDVYEIGMSHLGLQILYGILNRMPDILCERCYAPWPDMEEKLRQHGLPLCSLESRRPLSAFDIVGFSLQYELSYTNILMMLDLGGIPLKRGERGDKHPLIVAGGPAAFNPAPLADFIDLFVIGEGEEVISEIALSVREVRGRGGNREEQLAALAAIPGIYVPSIHQENERIKKRIIADPGRWREPLTPIVPLMKTIHDRISLEIARGCTRGCRFCQAGMVWRPVRERTPFVLEEMAEGMLKATGHNEISLLSLSSGDYSHIESLLATLMDRYYPQRIAMALPSLRAETITPRLIEDIRRVRKTSFTLAPEAGTQRLRDAINKGNTEEALLTTTERVFAAGWRGVKLYFMLGLPGERKEDLEGIIELAHKVLRTAKNRGQVTVSLSTFVPKPHTPFQWERQIGIEEINERQDFFKQRLKNRSISVKWHDARMSQLEGIFSRAGAETGALIEQAYRLGCRFDGWGDKLRFDLWQEALRRTGIDAAAYLRARSLDEKLPWEIIDCGVSREFLLAEAEKAKTETATPDCRTGPCSNCGVCDHKTIRVVTAPKDAPAGQFISTFAKAPLSAGRERSFRLRFTKLGAARFLSHLELSSALSRAMMMGGIFFAYSQGFHPHPLISFSAATSVGMESHCELADIRIHDPEIAIPELPALINGGLPEGVRVTAIRELLPNDYSLAKLTTGFNYTIVLPDKMEEGNLGRIEEAMQRFLAEQHFLVNRGNDPKAGASSPKENIKDIRPFVAAMTLDGAAGVIHLSANAGAVGTIRPAELLTSLFGFTDEESHRFRIVKTAVRAAAFAGADDRKIFLG
ncbi:MAG: TIGR03960 family B12-binding radical SAM protein [Syntrophales bacterium]